MSYRIFLIVHGHFYQPPRENPWTSVIELQESAAPYHDWNERITAECYAPNTKSRILDKNGQVVDIINNYEHMSFNFGPTLISYLEENHPDIYRRILEADQNSLKKRGHGNAVAQAYNHMIMPLASARDRWTQILWGLADFRSRFRREAEGMWLPETAANQPTIDDLVRAGMRFVLLAPSQAAQIRPVGSKEWLDVSSNNIPTDRAYLLKNKDGDLNAFFYNEGLSRGISFEHLLRNAGNLANAVEDTASRGVEARDRLVFICSDGESYGHHEAMGDMCMAFLATRELPARGITITNPMAFLEEHGPAWEVRLKAGEHEEGTSWSCSHGVGRWKRDCGCSTGAWPGWNQGWRAPLRTALDNLRLRIDTLYEEVGGTVLIDPWKARDEYISVILGKPLGAAGNFISRHGKGALDDEARGMVFRLLEMQRAGMLMYTSCGWFFSELSGIETVQNLKYAFRAAQLGQMIAGKPVDADYLPELAKAHSNLAEHGNGLNIQHKYVRPSTLSPEKVAAHHAVLAIVESLFPSERLYHFRVVVHNQRTRQRSGFTAYVGRLTVMADRTREGGTFDVAVIAGSNLRLLALVHPFESDIESATPDGLIDSVENKGFEGAGHYWKSVFREHFTLADMLLELRMKAVTVLVGPLLSEIRETYERWFTDHEGLLRKLAPLGIPIPQDLVGPASYAGSVRFNSLVERCQRNDLSQANELANLLRMLNIPLNKGPGEKFLSRKLQEMIQAILRHPDTEQIASFILLLESGRASGLNLNEAALQDLLAPESLPVMRRLMVRERPGGPSRDIARAVIELASMLNFNTDPMQKLLDPK